MIPFYKKEKFIVILFEFRSSFVAGCVLHYLINVNIITLGKRNYK